MLFWILCYVYYYHSLDMHMYNKFTGCRHILFAIGIFAIVFSSCSEKNAVVENNSEDSTAQVIKKTAKEEKKKIDWASVAIADGGGASLGATLSMYSANPYVIIATVAGIGVYASYSEYERQKEEIDNNTQVDNLIYEPETINPFHPFHPNPLTNDLSFFGDYTMVGEIHNQVVQYEYDANATENDIDLEAIFNDAMLHTAETVGANISDCDIDYYNDVVPYEEDGWSAYWNNLFQYYPEFNALFYTGSAENIYEYINRAIDQSNNPFDSETMAMCVAFYSRCMWNTMAPDPAFTQECFVWSPYDDNLQYVVGRDFAANGLRSYEDGTILLYPAYGAEGLVALYMYTDSFYGGYNAEAVPYVTVDDDLSIESQVFDGMTIQIPANTYEVEPTSCEGVYVINMQRYN